MPSYLLDKNIVRRLVEALSHLDHLSEEEVLVLAAWRDLRVAGSLLFVPCRIVHLLHPFRTYPEVQTVLGSVDLLDTGRYTTRWARRLRGYGFTREDAYVFSLATFGVSAKHNLLGVTALITLDKALINNYETHLVEIRDRLASMTEQLDPPYRQAAIPIVVHPERLARF